MQSSTQILAGASNLLAPRDDHFARRAARLEQLAAKQPDNVWLARLAVLSRHQQTAFSALSEAPGQSELKAVWQGLYGALFATMAGSPLAPQGAPPLEGNALDAAGEACLQLARGDIVAGARGTQDYLVAAAMQVVWSALASSSTSMEHVHGGAHKHCPHCGAEPVGSIVLAGEGKAGLRYLECSLCATRWHAVRAHCTLCDEGSVVSYLGLEGGNAAVQAECCDHCHGYVKTYFQDKDADVDPVADDLASLMLDVLVGQEGYRRASPNLFLAGVEPVEGEG
jgi:FdhE protein